MLTLALKIQLGCSKKPSSYLRYRLSADGLTKSASQHMLVLVGKPDPCPFLPRHIGVDIKILGKIIFKIQRRPMPVKAAVQHLMDVWVDLRDQIGRVSLGPTPAKDHREVVVLTMQPPDATLEPHTNVPSPAFGVIEVLAMGECCTF